MLVGNNGRVGIKRIYVCVGIFNDAHLPLVVAGKHYVNFGFKCHLQLFVVFDARSTPYNPDKNTNLCHLRTLSHFFFSLPNKFLPLVIHFYLFRLENISFIVKISLHKHIVM